MLLSGTSLLAKAVILPIQPEDLDYYWPIAVSFINKALEHTDGELSLPDIKTDIANHERALWLIKDQGNYIAAIVTMIYTTKSGVKIGDITLAGGTNHDKWDHFVDVISQEFKNQGCRFLDIPGRRGWVRKYQDRGFREKYVIMRRNL